MGKSNIGWTDAVWNPTRGCTRVSPGCQHCWAETLAATRLTKPYAWLTDEHGRWNGTIWLVPEKLKEPLGWKRPRKVFVGSMSDLFHERVPDQFIDQVFAVMALCPQHTFQILTKRPERMREYVAMLDEEFFSRLGYAAFRVGGDELADSWDRLTERINLGKLLTGSGLPLLDHVWLGVSCEDQQRADERIPVLLETPAAVRWVSFEPLLGGVRVRDMDRLDWAVIGGESGAGRREMEVQWMIDLVADLDAAGVPPFVKQDSHRLPGQQGRIPDELWARKEFP